MAQQTAVEFLESKIDEILELYPSERILINEAINQAKQMEKEQIIKAHCHNRCLNDKTYECSIKAFENSEQYYNETYGKQ